MTARKQGASLRIPLNLSIVWTIWGNNAELSETNNVCGEITSNVALNVQAPLNIAATNAARGCGGIPLRVVRRERGINRPRP
jgi:hypothetical protein